MSDPGDMNDLMEWYDEMAERRERYGAAAHEEGTCADDCWFCGIEDSEYERHRDDALTDAREPH